MKDEDVSTVNRLELEPKFVAPNFVFNTTYYSARRLIGSLWAESKVITLTE